MSHAPLSPPAAPRPEPRWPALVGLLAMGGIFLSLPEPLTPGPNWLLLVLIALLGTAAVLKNRLGRRDLNQVLGITLSAVPTIGLVWALAALIAGLPSHRESATALLRSAVAIWISNTIVFASWYWRLDAGGPNKRDLRGRHLDGAFLFPQMSARGERRWAPGFVDYLHLAFNTSTAFSPTDVAPLSRWAKTLMMIQSLISLAS